MSRYRAVWWCACTVLVVLGVVVAGVRAPVVLTNVSAAFAAVGIILVLRVASGRRPQAQRPRVHARRSYLSVLMWAGSAGATVGFVSVLGAPGLLVSLVLVVSSPYAIHAFGRWLRSMPTPSAAQLSTWSAAMAYASPEYLAFQPRLELCELTDEQLCSEWQASYATLQGRATSRSRMRTVQQRQRYLDEFERRNAGGLTAWLASGAWASSSPLPYLVESRSADAWINWDELMREQGW